MAKKVFNMQGGLHSAAAYSALENRAWGSCVADAASFAVSAAAGMNLSIAPGDGLISVDSFNARRIQVTATETVAVPAADATYNRLDSVVAYINTSVTPTTSVVDNTNNILMFAVVPGTAAATPVAPTNAAIQLAIGAGKPYMVLYDVLVPQGAVNVAGVTLTNRRKILTVVDAANIPALSITDAKIAAGLSALKISNPYRFAAYCSAGKNISNATLIVDFQTEQFDPNNNFASNKYTAPVSGVYMINAQVWCASAGAGDAEYCSIQLRKNGVTTNMPESERVNGSNNGNRFMRPKISTLIQLAAGDQLEVTATFVGSRDIVGGAAYTWFNGHLVSVL